MAEIDRAQFLRLGVAGVVGTVGAGLLAGPASAALPVPNPQGDDVGFLFHDYAVWSRSHTGNFEWGLVKCRVYVRSAR